MIESPTGLDTFAQPERPGLVFDLDEKVYHAGKNSLSASAAKVLLGKRPPTNRDALDFGTLVHTFVLEPEKLDREYAVLDPNEIGVLKDGSPAASPTQTAAWKNAVKSAEKSGLIVVSPDEWQRAHDMADAVRSHKRAAEILAACPHREVSAYAEYAPDVIIRGRFDLLGDNGMADLKTTIDADPDQFHRVAADYGYHISAAVYQLIARLLGLTIERFEFINVEKSPTPGGNFRVSVTELDDLFIAEGLRQFKEAVRRWIALGKRIDLPNFPDETVLVGCPDWLISDEMVL